MTARHAAAAGGLLLILFAIDAGLILAGLTRPLDEALLHADRLADLTHSFGGGAATLRLILIVTELGGAWVRVPVTLIAVLALAAMGRRHDAWLLAASIVSGLVAMSLIKEIVHRARPDAAWHLIEVYHPSFPSGHAMGSMTLYALLGLTIGRAIGGVRGWTAAGIALALAIGATRVALGVHWASDVVGGWLIGGAWVFGTLALAARQRRD